MRKEMGNKNRIRQTALSFTLTLCMVAGMITWPGAAIRSEADVTPPEKTISGVGSNGLRNPDIPTGLDVPWSGSIVYYGNKINESLSTESNDVQIQVLGSCPGKYRVLDPRTTEYGGTTMFLDSDTIIYYQQFNTECNTHTGDPSLQTPKNRWIDSPIRSELNGNRFLNRDGVFTDIERNAIAASRKNSFQYPFDGLPYGYHWSFGYWEAYTALTGEKIFLLDMSDLCRMAYGYNIGVNNGGGNHRTSRLKSIYGSELWDNWWLRSPDPTNSYNDYAGIFMEYYGVLNSSPVTSYRGVSPAFNVDLSKVIFTSPIPSETDTHKLTLLDSGYDFRISSPIYGGTVTETDSEYVFSSGFSLSDTDTNEGCYPNWMSYVITTGTWNDSTGWSEGAEVLKYEVFEDLDEGCTTGNLNIHINKSGLSGVWGEDYHVYVLVEDINDGYATDYASAPVEIKTISAAVDDVRVTYDGSPHGVMAVISGPEGATVTYGTSASTATQSTSPTVTDVTGNEPYVVHYFGSTTTEGYYVLRGTANITILPRSISGATVTLDNTWFEDNGTERTVNVTDVVLPNGTHLSASDYTVSGNTGTDVNDYTVTVTGTGNYTGTATASWAIGERPIRATAANVNIAYDGRPHGINVNVTYPTGNVTTIEYGTAQGTYNLTSSPTVTNVSEGTKTVYYRVRGEHYVTYTGSATISVSKANYQNGDITPPTAKTLTANGSAQALVNAGSVRNRAGTMMYALGNSSGPTTSYSTSVPTGTDAGSYSVWYYVAGDGNHNDSAADHFDVTIAAANNGNGDSGNGGSNSGGNGGSNGGSGEGNNGDSGNGGEGGNSEEDSAGFDFAAYGLSDKYVPAGYVDLSGSPMIIDGMNLSWNIVGGKSYWYENGVKQGTYYDPKGVLGKDSKGNETNRGREICDNSVKDANGKGTWFWLDAVYDGAKAVGKEVWVPYIYQKEAKWTDEQIRSAADKSDPGMEDLVYQYIKEKKGKWVRYDNEGRMLKGWVTIEGALAQAYPKQKGNTYYYDSITGLMAKGYVTIDGVEHHFNEVTGAMEY